MESSLLYIAGNQFGLKRVVLDTERGLRILLNDETRHGMQSTDPSRCQEPLAYYHRSGPLGQVFSAWRPPEQGAQVAVIGLGVGCMAAYLEGGQHMTFYEIDPSVAKLAADPRYFTFLSECRGTYEIILGDAGETLPRSTDRSFDMIILDAFVSGNIPPHLICEEVLQHYLERLAPAGILLFHISDNDASIQPALAAWAAGANLICLSCPDGNISDEDRQLGKLPSNYLIVARSASALGRLAESPAWTAA